MKKHAKLLKHRKKFIFRTGFTLIELLIVIVIITALAVAVFIALNPQKRLLDARNARQTTDIESIRQAINQYVVDNGVLPAGLTAGMQETQIGISNGTGIGANNVSCVNTTGSCNAVSQSCVDLTTPLATYLKSIPKDPTIGSASATGYSVSVDANNIITVKNCGMYKIIPTFSATFSAIHVSGNQLINVQGQQVVLRGVNRDSAELHCGAENQIFSGPVDAPAVQAIRSWDVNVVRVPLNEDCWLGINGVVVGGTTYQQAIVNLVNLLNQNGMYVILDLHWSAAGTTLATGQNIMADSDHSPAFWTSVANAFKGNNEVLFDLYNEPYVSSWSCWKNGGSNCTGSDAPFPIVGMQALINTVRSTGATNIIMLEGLSYGHDLTGWLANKPTDPLNNLTSSFHMYGNDVCATVSCWNSSLAPVMAQVPLIAGEFGESYDYSTCGTTAIDAFMNWMDQHNASYVAWEWDTWNLKCGTLSLISDWSGIPYSPNGTDVKAHLQSVAN